MNRPTSHTPNSGRFLGAFSEIEAYLRRLLGVESQVPFAALVRDAARRSRWIERCGPDLMEFAELRNAIVHRFRPDRPIAEPNDEITDQIERLARNLARPPCVAPLFQRSVSVIGPEASVATATRLMRDHGYSKLPVVEAGRAIGLLTTAALARWLGAEADAGLVDLESTGVAAVMRHAVDGDTYRIVGTSLPLGEAISFFLDRQESGRRLEAILITMNGRPDGKIVGLMTTSDLPTALRTLYPDGEPSPSS